MEKKPRYSRISDILDLAFYMDSNSKGVSLDDIAQRYVVSRKTAERMRDSLISVFPQIDIKNTIKGVRYWGFIDHSISNFVSFSEKEIANLSQLIPISKNKEIEKEINKTIDKLKILTQRHNKMFDENSELILENEGFAIRQGATYEINQDFLNILRTCFKNSKKISAKYHGKKRILEPLGLIYGEKIYLIAKEKAKGKEIYQYLLHKFEYIKETKEFFEKGDFNLKEYSSESFGIYHGKILNVNLWFSPKIAPEAKMYNFHPTQKIKENKDKSLNVSFKASGSVEICRNVFKWGQDCKILSPKSLQREYIALLEENLKNYK